MTSLQLLAKRIFLSAVDAVNPSKLVQNALHRHGDKLNINGVEYTLKHNVYIVGFGKAVYGMKNSSEIQKIIIRVTILNDAAMLIC